jgi:hypothetical protein
MLLGENPNSCSGEEGLRVGDGCVMLLIEKTCSKQEGLYVLLTS